MTEFREQLNNVQKRIDAMKPEYDFYNKKLFLSKEEAVRKSEIGFELYKLNIIAIGLLNQIDKEEGDKNWKEKI